MNGERTLREWIEKWKSGAFSLKDRQAQCDAGWYDWFCRDEALTGRLVKFGKILERVTNDNLLDNYRVWFKNNCPASSDPLYDDMRFEPMDGAKRDTRYFGITVDDKRRKTKYTVFTARKGYNDEFHFTHAREVVKFLNEWNAD